MLIYSPIILCPFTAISVHHMQAVCMPWFWGLVLKTAAQAYKEKAKGEFGRHQLLRNISILCPWKGKWECSNLKLIPLMNKITMNDDQRTSFHFNRHKILLVIRRERPIKVHPLFTSKKPSDQAIWKTPPK